MIINQNIAKRFWGMVDVCDNNNCWNWKGAMRVRNYGGIWVEGKPKLAHHVSLAIVGTTIPNDKVVDHLCRNPRCVNPIHLEVVSQKQNVKRGNADWRKNQTHCKKGHKFTENNTYEYKGHRGCKRCRYEAVIRYQKKICL